MGIHRAGGTPTLPANMSAAGARERRIGLLTPEQMQRLLENVARVRTRVAAACARAGRAADSVRMLPVTKYVDVAWIEALRGLGLSELGENRAQQLAARAAALGASRERLPPARPETASASSPAARQSAAPASAAPTWHMIGHLQRNKVRPLLKHCRILHSLDSPRLAHALEREMADRWPDEAIDALVELNLSGEAGKTGAALDQARPLIAAARDCPHVCVRGLMTMAPYDSEPEAARPLFARLHQTLDALRAQNVVGPECDQLSMGMSGDFEVAIEEGATIVRIGSILFEGATDESG